ncbi:XRE family transcriptional regulator [Sphingomonas sp. 28-63-12]|uniref:XRE family transcriptional regulator n=1 Tax=Sphingomonas sp. 28-63-12 TaxID=1970434 RepID=UPI000BDB9781|nr:MAG: hypothetical protein B7Y47_16660 [Sphingomonas sp. 28-63-12]
MTETAAQRLRGERERVGKSQRALADLAKINKNTQLAYENGTSPITLDYLAKVAVFGIDADYVASGHRGVSDRRTPYGAPPVEQGDTVEVAMSDVSYGMGGAYVDDDTSQTSIERFPRSFIRQFTKGPFAQLYFATGIGDSMQPTIHHNDLVLIDRSQQALRLSDQLWAVHASSIGMIKRVRVLPGGSVLLVSDNPDVSDYPVGQDELHLIGRVVAVVKRL